MNGALEAEGDWLVAQGKRSKALFLAALMHELTIAGRNSYRVATDELEKPSQLRKVNEIQHRVAACLGQVLSDQPSESFQRSIATWVLEQPDMELQSLMAHAWYGAKNQIS